MAERSFLCCRVLACPLPSNLADRPQHYSQDPSTHRIRLSIHQSRFHLLLSRKLLPDLLLRGRLSFRSHSRSLWPQYWENHFCHSSVHLRAAHLHTVHPVYGKSASKCEETLYDFHGHLWSDNGIYNIRLYLHRGTAAEASVRRLENW